MGQYKEMMINIQEMFDDGMIPEQIASMYGFSVEEVYEILYAMNDMDKDYDPGDMDGDAETALASAGWGTDEDYGGYGVDLDF